MSILLRGSCPDWLVINRCVAYRVLRRTSGKICDNFVPLYFARRFVIFREDNVTQSHRPHDTAH